MRYYKYFLILLVFLSIAVSEAFCQSVGPYQLSKLNKDGIPPLLKDIETKQQWESKKVKLRKIWLDVLGGLPDVRPEVGYRVISETRESNHVRKKIIFNTIDGDSVSAFLLIPNSGKISKKKYPAILAMQQTSEVGKLAVATPYKENGTNRYYGLDLVLRGYVVLAPDDLTSGERIYPGEKYFHSAPFYEKYPEWTIIAKTIVDHMQAVDLLQHLDFVDKDKIGVIGHSFGGYNVFFQSSVDPRIKVVVSSCGLSPFTGDPNPSRWGVRDWYTHFPVMTKYLNRDSVPFEMNEIVALSAPIPMFFYSAQNDRIFPHWISIGETLKDIHSLYEWLGYESRFQFVIGAGEHDFPQEVRNWAYDFLDRYLK
jgi:dienelactone hydrolase